MLVQRLAFGALLVLAAPAAADEFRPPSTITSVIVYPQGASVVRTASVDLPPGDSVVIIGGLPVSIEADSLKVEGSASSAVAIGSVETRYVPAGETSDPARQAILDAIRAIEDRIVGVEGRIAALEGRRRFLEQLIETTPAGFSAALSEGAAIDQWAAAAVTIGEGLAAAAREIHAARIEQRALGEDLAERQKELAELPAPQDSVEAWISLNAETAASGTIDISYRAPDAYWVPTYDAQLWTGEDGEKPHLTIVRRAEVTQATGEDWTSVALTLSTARTAGGTAAPFLAPNLVALFDEYEVFAPDSDASFATPRPMPAPSLAGQGAAGVPQEEAAKYIEAAANFGDFRAEYVVPGKVSVQSGEGARSLQVATEEMVARLEVRAVPMLSDAAYLHAAFVPDEGAPLLPGKISLFRDGTFVGTGELPLGRAGRELNLGFGVDDRVRITRVVLDRETAEHGILSTRKTDTQRFKITVDNLHSQPMEIVVIDRMPYAEDEDVTVARVRDATEPTTVNLDDLRGVLAWSYTYAPGETREIVNGYEVSWPADRQVGMLE
jgi:uncharacterized protein (TIGR02231 family)